MTQKSIVIKSALDARQAAFFVQTAGKFEAEIHVSVDEKKINAKSIMGTDKRVLKYIFTEVKYCKFS